MCAVLAYLAYRFYFVYQSVQGLDMMLRVLGVFICAQFVVGFVQYGLDAHFYNVVLAQNRKMGIPMA